MLPSFSRIKFYGLWIGALALVVSLASCEVVIDQGFKDIVNPPADPSNLLAQSVFYNQINLSWHDNSADESSFVVERSLNSASGYTVIATLASDTTSYEDKNANASTTYYYRVKAVKDAMSSSYSDVSNATTTAEPSENTIMAASAQLADVQEAVDMAEDGYTVQIPPGNVSWSSQLTLTKAITLKGDGMNSTFINNNSGTLIYWHPAAASSTLKIRLTGMTFSSGRTQANVVTFIGPATQIRVDHVAFEGGDSGVATNPAYNGVATGPVYGVVDHSIFHNMRRSYFATDVRVSDGQHGCNGASSCFGWTAWSGVIDPGTSHSLVFENNQFKHDSSIDSDADIYGQYGGRATVRYNTFTGYNCNYIDAHGDNPDYGTVMYEIYGNTFTSGSIGCPGTSSSGMIAYLRGGSYLIFNNTFNTGKLPVAITKYWCSDVHVIKNTFAWGNVLNKNGTTSSSTSQTEIVEPYDSGQCATSDQVSFQSGEPGAPYAPYAPYTYPHPLTQ